MALPVLLLLLSNITLESNAASNPLQSEPPPQESHVKNLETAPPNPNRDLRIVTEELEEKSDFSQDIISPNTERAVPSDEGSSWMSWSNIASLGTLISALATLVIAWFTFRAAKIAGISAAAASQAADLAEQSIGVARESYTASERPWVSVKAEIASDLVKSKVGIDFAVSFSVKNHGLSPARNVHVIYKVVTLKVAQDQFSGARESVYESGRLKLGVNLGIQLFPSEESVISWTSPLTNDEIQSGFPKGTEPRDNLLPSFYIIGSLFYQSVFSEKLYNTDFIYYVMAIGDPKYPKGSDVPEFEHQFPLEKLRLESVPYYKGTIS